MKGKCDRCGSCCKYIKLSAESLTADSRKWLEFHKKCYVYKNNIILLTPCKHLKRKNNKYICDIHGTSELPVVCAAAGCMKDTREGLMELEFVNNIRKVGKHD